MGNRFFLWVCAMVALVCALTISAVFFLAVWNSRTASPQMEVQETETAPSAPEETVPEPTEDWRLILVNPWNPLPEDYSLELADLGEGYSIDSRVYPALMQMLEAARAEGLNPVVRSAYRTHDTQQALYDNKVQRLINQGYAPEDAPDEAARWVARPGTSEHEAGLALDIVSDGSRDLTEEQENTPEQQWLMANAHRFGFILRYPKEKQDITGIGYEPWHYRYVGREAAEAIHTAGICLEEYLGKTNSPEALLSG